jgi:hypothetical protein
MRAIFFQAASDAGRDAEIFRWATKAASVPSAGIRLYKTDFAFLPV